MAKLSNRTFGVEFEMFFDYDKLYKLFEKYLSEEDVHYFESYSQSYNADKFLRQVLDKTGFDDWEVKEDGSIVGGAYQFEIVTPPMQGTAGLKRVIQFCNMIKPFADVNKTTGTHVHVGASDFIENDSDRLDKIVAVLLQHNNLETLFDLLVQKSRQGSEAYYAQPTDDVARLLTKYKTILQTEKNTLKAIIPKLVDTRYKKLNIQSLLKYGTLEFRQLHGTLNGELVKNWIIICMAFVDSVKEAEETFKQLFADIKQGMPPKPLEPSEITPEQARIIIDDSLKYFLWDIVDNSTRFIKQYGIESKERPNPGIFENTFNTMTYSLLESNGKKYIDFLFPKENFGLLFNEYDSSKMDPFVKKIIEESYRGYTDRIKNGTITVSAKPDGVHFIIPTTAIEEIIDSVGADSEDRSVLSTQSDVSKANTALKSIEQQYKLPNRNINKAYKQNELSPLKEEIKLLIRVINNG